MTSVAREVAELIHAETRSGSGAWDELNGPESLLIEVSDGKQIVMLPVVYDDEDQPVSYCTITIESAVPS
jgi:hypothetical protein